MFISLLKDPVFLAFLFQIDLRSAEEARQNGCPVCGGSLHWANYPRIPRGIGCQLGDEQKIRLSLCCGRDGCRKRLTPPSVRFLGRKVYFGGAVILFSALSYGVTSTRAGKLHKLYGVDRQTIIRWRKWWLDDFANSRFWKGRKGLFRMPPEQSKLPFSLFDSFLGKLEQKMVFMLRFLSPITSASAPGHLAF